MTEFFNRKSQEALRRQLRKQMPTAEVILWSRLRARQLAGLKFRRQYSIGAFVIDFYCAENRLAVELDGDTHCQPGAAEYDVKRQCFIESFGIRFVRFSNQDVYDSLEGVLEAIARACAGTDASPSGHTIDGSDDSVSKA